jgi:hypothetical protein
VATRNGGYLLARPLFQLDPSTSSGPSRVAFLFMIAKRSNVLSCREPEDFSEGAEAGSHRIQALGPEWLSLR